MTDKERQKLIAALRSDTFTLEMNYQVENHRIYYQPGDRYEKVLFHHCDLHFPTNTEDETLIHFNSCVFGDVDISVVRRKSRT